MVGIPFDHRFERRDDFFGALARSSIHHPQTPGMKVHAVFGEQRSRVEVVRKLLDQFAHGAVIGLGRLPAVRLGIGWEPQRHGLDVSLLGGRSATREINRLLDGRMGRCETVVAGGIVVVGSYGLGHSPIGHGQFGVKIRGMLKRARRFVMVESVDLTQSLVASSNASTSLLCITMTAHTYPRVWLSCLGRGTI